MTESVGSTIKNERTRLGMSQKELASLAGLANTVICHAEKDRYAYSKKSLIKIAKALNLDVNELLELKKSNYQAPPPHIQRLLCQIVDEWYLKWKGRVVNDNTVTHNLGVAKEELKSMLCDPNDQSKHKIFDEVHNIILKDS